MAKVKSVDEMRDNILAVYNSATKAQHDSGMNWYSDAHDIAQSLSVYSGYSIEQTSGVIAAVSPLNSWGHNVVLANRIIAKRGAIFDGYLSNGLSKARDILSGDSAWNVLKSNKIRAFFECILHNGETDAVCIDRHAYSVAVNSREDSTGSLSITDRQYALIREAYSQAAIVAGISGAKMQAITWVVWRNRYWAEGAWDGKGE